MGNYLNPGNAGFAGIRKDVYVDKSGLIGLINQTIDTPRRLTCICWIVGIGDLENVHYSRVSSAPMNL